VTTICFWNRSVLGLIDSGTEGVTIRKDDHPFDDGRTRRHRHGAKSSGQFLRNGHGRLAAAVIL